MYNGDWFSIKEIKMEKMGKKKKKIIISNLK